MKGLILKDLYNFLNQQGKTFLVLVVMYFLIALQMQSGSILFSIGMILGITLIMNSIAYDEKAHWDKYALTMPVSRKDLVTSKYLLLAFFMIAGNIISIPMVCVIEKGFHMETLAASGILLGIGMFFGAIMLPVIFQFGVECSRILSVAIIALPFALVFLLDKLHINLTPFLERYTKEIAVLGIICVGIVYIASYMVSVYIMEHKEIA